MTPTLSQMLMVTAGDLGGQFAPNLPNSFLASSAQIGAVLSIFAAQEAERAADIRVAENQAMRALFAELAPLASPGLRTKLDAAAHESEHSYALSALDAANAALKTLLIGLHEEVEGLDGAAGQEACVKIWGLLKEAAAARQFHFGPG